MSNEQDIWETGELRQDNTLIGTLVEYEQDMFWFSCYFEPTPAFEPYRTLFSEGQDLIATDQFDDWYAKVNGLGLQLVRQSDGKRASEFILYISDDKASFRPRFQE